MIKEGEKIETDFTLDVLKDGEEQKVKFDELLQRSTIVSVYMKNNTPGCDKQIASLAGQARWFDQKGYDIIGISKDSIESHKKYAQQMNIDFALASDPEFKFGKATGSMIKKKKDGKTYNVASRSAYLLKPDGAVFGIIKKVDTKRHGEELKNLIRLKNLIGNL